MLERWNAFLKKHHGVASWLLILVATVFFRGVLTCGYVIDDMALILRNPIIKNPHLWRRIFLDPMWSVVGAAEQINYYRPLGISSLWLVCRVAGLNPAAYHFFQLILYSLGIWMVYQIGRKLLPSELAAFAGALLWTLHPLHVEAVAWASAIPDIGCGLFCLMGFRSFLRAEAQSLPTFRDHALAAAVFSPALFFKELAFTFPLLILAYWFCFSPRDSWARRVLHWLPYATAMAVCAVIRVAAMGQFGRTSLFRGFQPRVVWAAVGLLGEHAKGFFWPVRLSAFREFSLAASLHSPWPWAALVILAVAAAGRKRDPLLSFLVLWWFVMLLPCLDYRQLSLPLVEDQFSYLPSVGLCLALGYLAFGWLPRHFPKAGHAWVVVGALAAVATLWAAQTLRAIPRWNSNDTLFEYGLRVSPSAPLVHVTHGVVLQFRNNDLDGAAREFQTALRLNAQSFRPLASLDYESYIGLGQVALLQGREAEALSYFDKAVHLLPHFSFAYNVLGSFYFPRGDYAQAAEYFRQAVGANPMDPVARFYLGTCLMKLGMPAKAAEQFHAAREVDPTYSQAYLAEAAALEAAGDKAGAARVSREMSSRKVTRDE